YEEDRDSSQTKTRYDGNMVFNMVDHKDINTEQEPNSVNLAPGLVREVWAVARQLKVPAFRNRIAQQAVLDDHLPLNNAGIPSIDVIDFDYPHWHTADDLPEQCSAASLDQVGRVITAWLAQPRSRRR